MIESHIYKTIPKGFLKAIKKKTDIKQNIILMFSMICNKLFKWEFENENATEEIESYIIEKLLFENGRCLFFEEGGHYFITMVAEGGQIDAVGRLVKAKPLTLDNNRYNDRIIRNIVEKNGEEITIKKPNAVLIKNNLYDLSTLELLAPFIDTLNYIWQSLQIALSNNRTKRIIVATDPNQANIIKKEIKETIDGVESVRVVTDKTATDGLKTIESTNNGQDIKDIRDVFDWLYNWLLTFMGVDSMAQVDKESGKTTEEVESNKTQTNLFLESMFDFRKKAVEQINKITNAKASIKSYAEINKEEMQKQIVDTMMQHAV